MKNLVKTSLLMAALLLLTSCGPETEMPAVWYVPLGIEILAWIGFVAVILLVGVFILSFGSPSHSDSFEMRE